MVSVLELAERRHRALTALLDASPDALLGAWALRNSENARAAARLLSRTFQLTPEESTRAIRQARVLPDIGSRGPLDGITGYPIPRAIWTQLWNWATAICGKPRTSQKGDNSQGYMRVLLTAQNNGTAIRSAARAAATTNAPSQIFVTAGLIASLAKSDDFHDRLSYAFPHASNWGRDGKFNSRDRREAHLLAMAFALSCIMNEGIALPGGPPWRNAPISWITSVAPWIAPLLATDCGDGLRKILTTMRRRRIRPAAPHERLPSLAASPPKMLVEVAAMASALKPHIRKASTVPISFTGGPNNLQIIVVHCGDCVYACVAEHGTGIIVGFQKESLLPFVLPHEDSLWCAALAIAWYLDTSAVFPARSRKKQFRKTSTGSGGITYRPTAAFQASRRKIVSGDIVPLFRRHFVMGHVRVLPRGQKGSDKARKEAPPPIRKELEKYPNKTWVREHWRGEGEYVQQLELHLTRHSALATVLGLRGSGRLGIGKTR